MIRLLVALLVMTAACAPRPASPPTLSVMTHDSFSASETVIQAFEEANNLHVAFLKSGDAGEALNKAILAREAPLADVFFGLDNTFLGRALSADILESYSSPALDRVPTEYILDPSHRALPVDFGDVCINYDRHYFEESSIAPPASLEDLADPRFRNLLVVENPASSSPGLAFLLATISHFGDPGYLEYWRQLRANEVVVVDGWDTAYYTNFSGSSGRGPQPLVVSYASSPAAEVMFAPVPLESAPTASIVAPDTCFRQIEFVGILKGTRQQHLARQFVDFLLDPAFQADVPAQMFVFPVLPGVELPLEFTEHVQLPAAPAALPPEEIAANRDAWIRAWTEAVLR